MNSEAMANPMKTRAPSKVTFRTEIFLAIKAPHKTKNKLKINQDIIRGNFFFLTCIFISMISESIDFSILEKLYIGPRVVLGYFTFRLKFCATFSPFP